MNGEAFGGAYLDVNQLKFKVAIDRRLNKALQKEKEGYLLFEVKDDLRREALY
jgi:hypothetical protein